MARATWSGSISFGLVSVPVQLFTAVRSHTVHFTQLHRETGNRVRNKRVDEESGEEVSYDDIVKGYEVADGQYVVVDPDELDELDPEASRLIDIHDFVELTEIDPVYYDRAYYLMPSGEAAAKPYKLLADAMERSGKVAVARFVMRNKEYLAAVRARDGLLLLSTMHYADEVADPAGLDATETLEKVEVAPRELAMAEQLIDSLVAEFDPTRYHDEYQERVTAFLEAKAEGQEVEITPPERDTGGVIDLMAALEQSLDRAKRDRGEGEGRDDGAGGRGGGRDYGAMSKDELYELAQERDLPGRSSMSKEELAEALADGDRSAKAS
ncbi:Ku protein [Egicoccus sp. AB-alg2]|uniref:non-homologous end joining protein Ku n=1 Tax=Egicoccus sp. AB-alg2 TaxID=3242693 RepID=UPI00359DBEE2